MSTTFTTKYGLIKPTPGTGEIVNVADLNLNSDTIDSALGAQVVNDGVVVPPASIRDGMIVSEKTTGISYILVKNNVGGFDKRFLTSPYLFIAFQTSQAIGGTGAYGDWGWPNIAVAGLVNSSAADISGSGASAVWKAPFDGIFTARVHDQFTATTTGNVRGSVIKVNGTIDGPNTETVHTSNGGTSQSNEICYTRKFSKNDTLGHAVLLTNASVPTLYSTVEISCIQRLGA